MPFTIDTFADCLKAGDTLILEMGRFVRVSRVSFPGDGSVLVRAGRRLFLYRWDDPVAVVGPLSGEGSL